MEETSFDKTFKNEKLREIVRSAILRGEYKPGDLLPSQNEMCDKYGVSNHTVREAIGSLVHEGLLYRIQGKGTFVSERKLDKLTLGFITSRMHRDFGTHYRLGYSLHPLLLQHIEEKAGDYGASVIVSLHHEDIDAERRSLIDLVERRVGGIISFYIGGSHNLDCLEKIRQANIPLVLVDRYLSDYETDYVVTDNFKGAYRAAKFLLDRGFKKIFYFTIQSGTSVISERMLGYRKALEDYGIEFDESLVQSVCSDAFPNLAMGNDFHGASKKTKEILRNVDGPFAVFASSGIILAGVWRSLRDMGIDHSRLGLACFDVPIESIPKDIPLIKVVQPLEEIGRRSVQIIIDKLNGNTTIQKMVVPPSYRIMDGKTTSTQEEKEYSASEHWR